MRYAKPWLSIFFLIFLFSASSGQGRQQQRSSTASYPEQAEFSSSASSDSGLVYEVLPGPAVMNPAMNPTPFSNNIFMTRGSYSLTIADLDAEDSPASRDSVVSVDIRFTGNDGRRFKIDAINIVHKEAGSGDHTFFGGVGRNKMMHGNTGIGTALMPKMLAYITLWGVCDLKDADSDSVIAPGRPIHLMVATRVRNDSLRMLAGAEIDSSDHNLKRAETHIILAPQDAEGNSSPVPGTDHGFLHMMFEEVTLSEPTRDHTLAFEVLPGPAVLNPAMNPTPFSNRVAIGAGSFSLKVLDYDSLDSPASRDSVAEFSMRFERADGTVFVVDKIDVTHKPEGSGDHTFFGGVGLDKTMHGNTGIGTTLMPKLFSYITLWGTAALKDGEGAVLAGKRPVHIMVASRVRTDALELITSSETDASDHSPDKVEVHVIFPPQDTTGAFSPLPGSGHGFLHLMFEQVALEPITTSVAHTPDEVPNGYSLLQNYPNPFNPSTTIRFTLQQTQKVQLNIYNSAGQRIRTLISGQQSAGEHSIVWNGADDSGTHVASGVYFYELRAGSLRLRKKLVLTK